MSRIPDNIGKEMIEWCKKEYNPNYSGYTILIPAIEHGYSLALERIGELEKENAKLKEHLEGEIGALQLIAKHFSQSVIDDQMGEDAIDLNQYKK